MSLEAVKGYGRFTGQVFGAACLGGVLAAAGELLLGAALGQGPLWGTPRRFFQILLGAEAAWAGVLNALILAAGCSLYYLIAKRRRTEPVRLDSPPLFILVVALLGVPYFYFLATFDFTWFYYKPAVIIWAAFPLGIVVWFCAAWGIYSLINRIGRRSGARGPLPVALLRVLAVALLVPFVVAEGWAMWRERGQPPRRPDIYLVVMDAYRADRLSYYGGRRYIAPALETFGSEAAVFKEAYTVSMWTKPAIASTFTSTYPGTHGVNADFQTLPDEAVTLAETLRAGGYRTICVSANPHVSRQARMADGFDIMDDVRLGPVFNAAGPPVSFARPFIACVRMRPILGPLLLTGNDGLSINARLQFWSRFARGRPAFFYVHYMEPHIPNLPGPEYLPEFQPYLAKVAPERRLRIAAGPFFWYDVLKDPSFVPDFNNDEVALARALYDADVRLMDSAVEGLLENVVVGPGRDADAVIVITADHGEEFLEHGRWMHGAGLHHEIARIPLMIKAPGCEAAVFEGPVNLIDLAPTLASLAGLDVPESWEGLDLAPYMQTGSALPPRDLLLEGINTILMSPEEGIGDSIRLSALVTEDYFYLIDENADVEYLYDRRDRWQRKNLAADDSFPEAGPVLAACREKLARYKSEAEKRAFAPGEVHMPPALRRQLKTLGYVK